VAFTRKPRTKKSKLGARDGFYYVQGHPFGTSWILISKDPIRQEMQMEICRQLRLRVERQLVSLAIRGSYATRLMVGPLDEVSAKKRRQQINQLVSIQMQPTKRK
jgi:hypothetical protein